MEQVLLVAHVVLPYAPLEALVMGQRMVLLVPTPTKEPLETYASWCEAQLLLTVPISASSSLQDFS